MVDHTFDAETEALLLADAREAVAARVPGVHQPRHADGRFGDWKRLSDVEFESNIADMIGGALSGSLG